ncbi:Zinc finger bed domain-containing protein 4 [Plakobranchus ocellatus]|uniref:Zinc finger bed domain-containing protein 4 n=1 Tax=Plakobranchus ocellatus TaxID=259542 RepID=A0AAV3Y0H2_9GAST|nr:Zinc finger bed domain-containing protein 4 [Plakobranchus ocellatus]
MVRSNGSLVWLYIKRVDAQQVQCKLCGKSFGYFSSTSNLRRHLKRKHPDRNIDKAFEGVGENEESKDFLWRQMENASPSEVTLKLNQDENPPVVKQHIQNQFPDLCNQQQDGTRKQRNLINLTSIEDNESEEQDFVRNPDSDEDYMPASSKKRMRQQVYTESNHKQGIIERANTWRLKFEAKKRRQNRSVIWELMDQISLSRAKCKVCGKIFTYQSLSTTSNMLRHLRIKHPEELNKIEERKATGGLDYYSQDEADERKAIQLSSQVQFVPNSVKKIPVNTITKEARSGGTKQLDNFVVKMLVSNLYPSHLVEDTSFKNLIAYLNPKCSLSGRKFTEEAISDLYKKQQNVVQLQLDEAPGMAISLDMWIYRERRQYMTVTGHFVSKSWELHSVILKTILLNTGTHLGASISESLTKILKDWNVSNKVQCIISDNTKHINEAIAHLNVPHFHCIAHTLNIIVQNSLKASDDIIYVAQRVRDVAGYFQNSTEATEKLNSLQNVESKMPVKLPLDTETNWISTYKMFKCYLELHNNLRLTLLHLKKEDLLLSSEEVELMSRCIQVLEPFHLATVEMASDGYTAMSKFIPVFEILKQMTSNLVQVCPASSLAKPDCVHALAKELNEQVEQYMRSVKERAKLVPWTTTLLDPRFKHIVLSDDEVYSSVEESIQQFVKSDDQFENGSEPMNHTSNMIVSNATGKKSIHDDATSTALLWSMFDETIKKSVVKDAPNDLHRYNEERPIVRQENPYIWWKERDPLYPKLCPVVRQFLCIPSTSVPSDQVFSEEAYIKINRRNFLEESLLDSYLFLNCCHDFL